MFWRESRSQAFSCKHDSLVTLIPGIIKWWSGLSSLQRCEYHLALTYSMHLLRWFLCSLRCSFQWLHCLRYKHRFNDNMKFLITQLFPIYAFLNTTEFSTVPFTILSTCDQAVWNISTRIIFCRRQIIYLCEYTVAFLEEITADISL